MRTSGLLFLALFLAACTPGLRLRKVTAGEGKPANVVLFFGVSSQGEPISGLPEDSFVVKEDGLLIPQGKQRIIVNPDVRASQYTLVLVDVGGQPTDDELGSMAAATRVFVDRLGSARKLGILAYDGAEQPVTLASFGAGGEALVAAANRIATLKPRDSSTDLNGAYLASVRALRTALEGTDPKIATLILIARGPDRAARVPAARLDDELKRDDEVDLARFSLGLGLGAKQAPLPKLSTAAPVLATTGAELMAAAERLATTIDGRGQSYYLLSYCSPARAGEHDLVIEAEHKKKAADGKVSVEHAKLHHRFSAAGFGGGCVPSIPSGWKR